MRSPMICSSPISASSPFSARGPRIDAPLYRFPIFGFFALSIAAAAFGNARGAIDDLSELAAGKTAQGSSRVLAERPATQAAVGEAEAALRAARALYYEAIEEAWAAAQQDGPVEESLHLGLRLAATHAVQDLRRGGPVDVRPGWRHGDL